MRRVKSYIFKKSSFKKSSTLSKWFLKWISRTFKRESKILKSKIFFYQQIFLNLRQDLRQMISLKAQVAGEAKQEHKMQFLADYSTFGILIQGMSFIWQSHYGNTKNECPKLDPLCRKVLLERQYCKCAFTYSICKANIDLDNYHPIVFRFNNKPIKLTLALLMDYGVIHQLVFSNPK